MGLILLFLYEQPMSCSALLLSIGSGCLHGWVLVSTVKPLQLTAITLTVVRTSFSRPFQRQDLNQVALQVLCSSRTNAESTL
jgi:hypothetical protein